MSFINFNNRTAPEAGKYSARMIAEALYQVETKNINKIKSLVESIKEPLATAEALNLFENKLVALNALQTAAANALPVNEGQFSWMTQDTGEQIGSERENRITVYMYDNEGNQYKEDKYDGYGEFGGMDYYELLARMNGYTEEDLEAVKGPFKELRQLGIDVAFDKLKTKDKGRKVLYPALVTDPRYNWKKHDFTQEPESDPDQSWYVEPEYDEDEYYESKTNEAKKVDVMYALKDIKAFNSGTSTFEETIESIIKNLGYKTTSKNIEAATEHIGASQEDEDEIPVDKDLIGELYGILESKVNETRSITKIQKEWAKVTAMMKDTVDKWKAAEGQEKEDLLTQLKTLTISKKKLEAELDDAVGLKDADAELVGEAKNEIKYYKTISKKDWDKAPKDYKSTIDGEHYMMFLDKKLGSILAPVKVEEAYTEDYYGKSLKKDMDKVIAANEGLNWDSLIEKINNVSEDWGSSDQNIMNKAIHKDAGSPKRMPSPFDSKLRAAAEDAVDFYWDEWEEYQTDRDSLIDNAVRSYLRSYFKKDFELMQRMFEPVDEKVVTEAVAKNTQIYQIATPAPKAMLVGELEDLFGDDYRHIVTEFDDDEGYESVLVFNLSKKDVQRIQNEIGDVLIWEYSIKKGKEITESVVTEAKFVKDFNRDVLNAKTKEEVLELYPNAEFFIGKSDHFFGELDTNLFFKAYYTKAQKEFEIKSIYSEKGSNYVHLYNESVVTEAVKEVTLSNRILNFLEERGVIKASDSQKIHKDLTAFLKKNLNESAVTEAGMNDPVLVAFRAAKMNREKELAKPKRRPLYGKQRMKAEDDLWQISQDLKDLYADRGQMLIDMEQEAEVEGGPIADEYGDRLNKVEDQIQKLIAKRSTLEMRLAESFINEEEDYSDEMTYGQLERCIDYATMLRERYDGGFSFDPWMHSAVTTAKNELNSVFDALDGGDGVIEGLELTESVMSDIHQLASEVKESVVTEKREDVGKYNTVKKVIAELGRRPSEQELATFITNNYYDVTEVERGDDDPASNDKIADLVAFYKFDIDDWNIAWADAQNESVVTESTKLKKGDVVKFKDGKTIYILEPKGDGYDYRDSHREKGHHPKGWFDMMISTGKAVVESVITEGKALDRDAMMDWLDQTLSFTRTSEEFDGAEGGIWTTGENGEEWKGKVIYAYYSEDYKNRTFGVLNSWEKELNKRGWYSEWYDAGTVMIWPN